MNKMKISLILFDKISFVKFIKDKKIKIYEMKMEEDHILLLCSYFTYLKLKKKYENIVIIKDNIISRFFLSFKKSISIILCLFISLSLFFYCENKIFYIEINGVSEEINNQLKDKLANYGIKKNISRPSIESLDLINKEIHNEMIDKISVMSITLNGVYIIVNYQKRKNPVYIEKNKTKIYAKKDAVIKDFVVISGNVLIRRNQFVRKGELLVDDTIIRNEKEQYIGTNGIIYGYVFYKYILNKIDNENEFVKLLFNVKNEICKDYMEGEFIEKETIINQNEKCIIHFTCVEILNSY